MRARNAVFVVTVLCLLGLSAKAQMSFSTADGSGADTFVGNDTNKPPTSNYGANGTMDIRHYANVRAHIGYVRFDISGAGGASLTGAQLQLYITSAAASRTWDVYGLTDHAADDAWGEMTITYNNAPGMLPAASGNYAIDPAKLTLLGTLAVASGSNYALTSSTAALNLDLFLTSDTNGLVTFVLIGPNNGDGSQYYAGTKEGVAAPVLILPNASNVQAANMPLPDGSTIESATDVTLSWRPGQLGGAADPSITGYYLYIAPLELVCDPGTADFSVITPIYVPRGAGLRDQYPASGPGLAFGECKAVYWRVDESVNGSGATSPDTVIGPEWRFETAGTPPPPIRYMENLGRGVIAIRTSSTQTFVSWRLLALDPSDIAFNVYRSAAGGGAVKLNGSPLTGGTNYADTTADLTKTNTYYVRPVIGGVEQDPSGSYTLIANAEVKPDFTVPLQNIGDYYVHLAWVGDLDGNGEYDFVVDRIPNVVGQTPKVEAYKRDGTFLWRVDMGPNSIVDSDINDGPVAGISNGHNDHVTVYDLDSDGLAEVIIKTANGVIFGNGSTLTCGDNTTQFISVLNGMTGAELARAIVPNPYAADGGLGGQFGIGYFNGVNPAVLFKGKNRNVDDGFNLVVTAWAFDGGSLSQYWTWSRNRFTAPPNFHQIRILDIDGDGRDEFADGGYVLEHNGTLLYDLGDQGVNHGDRFHIGDLDPIRPGLEGYAIQQNNPSCLAEYYYDAGTGQILWEHYTASPTDLARGIAADVDPRYPGYEVWSFLGIYNGPTHTQLTQEPDRPWPNFRIWWDGDVLSENLNETKIDKWNYLTSTSSRLLTGYNYDGAAESWREAPAFYGDIIGDWREEVVFESYDHTKLVIFTTHIPSSVRLYTLAQNPEYRNCMTAKGYMQSHLVDYYLGDGMATPPTPNITIVGSTPDTTPPPAPTGLTATPGDSNVLLNWADNTEPDLAGYNVYRSMSSGHSYAAIATDVAVSSYTDNTAQNGTAYYYVVTAVDTSSNESDYSNEVSATPQDTTPPMPNPATFATAPNATGSDSITMVATTGSDASGPVQYLFTETSGNPGGTSSGWQTSATYVDSGLNASTQYTYTVTMRDALGNAGTASAPASATTQSATPTFVAAGSIASGTGTITPALPAGIASGDILLLFVETANQAVSITNQNGGTWTAVTGSPQGTGTAAGTSATRLTVFWSRYNGTQGAPTVSDSGNHQLARMIAIRGAVATGNPWDVTAGGVEATSDTSGSIPSATTTVANTLVVVAVAGSLPDSNGTANFSAWTNAGLTSLTERTDDTRNAGNGGALGIATGIKVTAGAYGNTTVTHASSAVKGMISIAIKK